MSLLIVCVTALLRVAKSKVISAPVVIPDELTKVTIPTAVPNPMMVVPAAIIPLPLLSSAP